jgi:hypothetical protein
MKPTVYLPVADLCLTGLRRVSASSAARFDAGRIETQRHWTEMEGKQVGTNDQRKQSAGSSGPKRTP